MTTKKILAHTVGAVALAISGLAITVPAQAGPGDWSSEQSWWLDTRAQCLQMQQNYVTPNTRITTPCRAAGPHWYFSWQTRL